MRNLGKGVLEGRAEEGSAGEAGAEMAGEENEMKPGATKPGRVPTHSIVAVLVSSSDAGPEGASIVAVDSSGLVCVWNAATGAQKTCFQAERPLVGQQRGSEKPTNTQVNERESPISGPTITTAGTNAPRPFELIRSGKGYSERDDKRGRPWKEMPKSYAILQGVGSARGDADGHAPELGNVTAASLDLFMVRLVLGWDNGEVYIHMECTREQGSMAPLHMPAPVYTLLHHIALP
jgi:hypothetical protein